MSLRTRLVAVVLTLLAAGLLVAAGATLAALRFFLLARTDTQLDQLSSVVVAQASSGRPMTPMLNGGRAPPRPASRSCSCRSRSRTAASGPTWVPLTPVRCGSTCVRRR